MTGKLERSTSLTSYIQAQREAVPIPERESLTAEEEWHCRIIGGDFLSWQQNELPHILRQRTALKAATFDPDPLLIFTTTMPGLVAAQEIMPSPPEQLAYLLHDEFSRWETENPAGTFTFHIHRWSYFKRPDPASLGEARAAFPTVPAAEFRVHSSGTLWAEHAGTDNAHLWRWTGSDMELLQESFSRAVF